MTDAPSRFDVEFWLPDPRLNGLVSGYHCYAVTVPEGERHHDVFFPSWANLRFHSAADVWRVRFGERSFDVPAASLFGPTSRAGYSESGPGAMIGAGLTPLGWHRLTRRAAADFADRVVPLQEILGADANELAEAARAPDLKERFDAVFLRLLSEPRPDEARITEIHHYLMEPVSVPEMADRVGLSQRTLNRIALSAFGFGPKLLIRRARFLRSLMALRDAPTESWALRIESSYYDHSHFNRDAQEFLGMSPTEFMRLPKPLNDASARLRTRILGAPMQALHQPLRLTGEV
ncbi:MAG TPA: helix-turn-helix domain-containing protein [Sphingomonas sp.]|nr:helix-turn-helix domain-containing protein [Sphingomonas sp.]